MHLPHSRTIMLTARMRWQGRKFGLCNSPSSAVAYLAKCVTVISSSISCEYISQWIVQCFLTCSVRNTISKSNLLTTIHLANPSPENFDPEPRIGISKVIKVLIDVLLQLISELLNAEVLSMSKDGIGRNKYHDIASECPAASAAQRRRCESCQRHKQSLDY